MQMLNDMKNKGEPPAMDDLDDLVSARNCIKWLHSL